MIRDMSSIANSINEIWLYNLIIIKKLIINHEENMIKIFILNILDRTIIEKK